MVNVEKLYFGLSLAQNQLWTESDLFHNKNRKANETYRNHTCTRSGAEHWSPTGCLTDCKMKGDGRAASGNYGKTQKKFSLLNHAGNGQISTASPVEWWESIEFFGQYSRLSYGGKTCFWPFGWTSPLVPQLTTSKHTVSHMTLLRLSKTTSVTAASATATPSRMKNCVSSRACVTFI